MNYKKATLIIWGPGIDTYERSITIAPKTTGRALRGQLRFPSMWVSREKGGRIIPQGEDLFDLVKEGGKLYALVSPKILNAGDDFFVQTLTDSFVGAATDIANDVAAKHDLYLAGLGT